MKNALEPHEAQILAWNVEGVAVSEQVRRLGALGVTVSRQALYQFKARHRDGIEKPKARVRAAVVAKAEQRGIATAVGRVDRLGAWIEGVEAIRTGRGLIASEPKWVGPPEDGREVMIERFDAALVHEAVRLYHEVGEQLGQLKADAPPAPVERRDDGFSAYILGDSAIRELGQQLFAAAAMGARDAGGTGLVRKRSELGPGAAPDDGQRRPATDRLG